MLELYKYEKYLYGATFDLVINQIFNQQSALLKKRSLKSMRGAKSNSQKKVLMKNILGMGDMQH